MSREIGAAAGQTAMEATHMATRYGEILGFDQDQERKAVDYIHGHRTWFIMLGVALIILGVIATLSSITTTFVSMFFLAALLLIGGIIRFVSAFSAREWSGSLLLALAGALYIVAGVLTFRHPVAAALALTLLFAALFMAVGLFRMIAAVWHRFASWGWVALSGAVSFVLGLMLWNQWPVSGLWFIGLCIGIDLIVEGIGWLMLCYGADTAHAEQAQRPAAH
jgi:uncharacterized membrane protein HdeD (DUF308 family)